MNTIDSATQDTGSGEEAPSGDGHTKDGECLGTSADMKMLHIKPVSIETVTDEMVNIKLMLYPDGLDKLIFPHIQRVLTALPLSRRPEVVEISANIGGIGDVTYNVIKPGMEAEPIMRVVNPTLSVKKRRFRLPWASRAPTPSETDITDTIKWMYGGNEKEENILTSNCDTSRVSKSVFRHPVSLGVSLDFADLKKYIPDKSDKFGFSIASPNTQRLVALFKAADEVQKELRASNTWVFRSVKKTWSEVASSDPKKHPVVPKPRSVTIWLALELVGTVMMLSSVRLNFICKPISIFILTPCGNALHLRLFGLQYDKSLCGDKYGITMPFQVYSKFGMATEKPEGKLKNTDTNEAIRMIFIVGRTESMLLVKYNQLNPLATKVGALDFIFSGSKVSSAFCWMYKSCKGNKDNMVVFVGKKEIAFSEYKKFDYEEMQKDKNKLTLHNLRVRA